MCTRLCCFVIIEQKEQYILSDCTSRSIITGPKCCHCIMPWVEVEVRHQLDLKQKEFAMRINHLDPSKNKYIMGPGLLKLEDPFEDWEFWFGSTLPGIEQGKAIQQRIILDQDDYLVVINKEGIKRNVIGPAAYAPEVGEVWEEKKNTVQVPMNYYIVVNDSNDKDKPVKHVRGPTKFVAAPFQSFVVNKAVAVNLASNAHLLFPCFEVTSNKAIHISRSNAKVEMMSIPGFYMPEVGETIIKSVDKTVLLMTDFCILKGADGKVAVMNGRIESQRAFFVQPFYEMITFNCETQRTILSTLPTFMSHRFMIRTSDNVQLDLDVRISYQLLDVDAFALNPIDFYPLLKNHIQNAMLDEFAKNTLREFMTKFADIAKAVLEGGRKGSLDTSSSSAAAASGGGATNEESSSEDDEQGIWKYFKTYGIQIIDIQILNYLCVSKSIQDLLEMDIHTNVHKQNELRARQNDVLIQEQNSEVQRKQKDLEVKMFEKDSEVSLKRKQLEIDIRLKEMDIEIQEEHKRKELLEVKRGNDLVEAQFEGRAKGDIFKEFVRSIDPNLTNEQKVSIWRKEIELEQARLLYGKVDSITMYPPDSDLKMYNFLDSSSNNDTSARQVKDGVIFQTVTGFLPPQQSALGGGGGRPGGGGVKKN